QALIVALPGIIAASVKPIEKIDGIKIVQVDGLNRGATGGVGVAPAGGGAGGGSLAEQAVSAALAYRAQQPILDAVLGEIGMKGGSLAGLVEGMKDEFVAPTPLTAPAPAAPAPAAPAPAPAPAASAHRVERPLHTGETPTVIVNGEPVHGKPT